MAIRTGWSSLEAGQLLTVQAKLQAFLQELTAQGRVIAGVLPPDEDHPIRIVTRQDAPRSQTPQRIRQQRRRPDEA